MPYIDWDLTSPRVLTMELIDGIPLAAILAAAEAGDRKAFDRAAPGVPAEA